MATRSGVARGTVACAAMLVWLLPAMALAQATGTIAGVASDQSGAVLPGVAIEITNTATGQVRTATTGSDGFYSVVQLQPGIYSVRGALTGFAPVVRPGIEVSVGDTSRVDLKLPVGVQESV